MRNKYLNPWPLESLDPLSQPVLYSRLLRRMDLIGEEPKLGWKENLYAKFEHIGH